MSNLKDLIVKRGRLINNAPDGISGIQRAVEMKREIRRESKIQMMAEAVSRGDMMSNAKRYIFGK
jgi:ABC-type sugar transport system ATPase subunit